MHPAELPRYGETPRGQRSPKEHLHKRNLCPETSSFLGMFFCIGISRKH